MSRKFTSVRNVVQRIAPIACVAILGVTTAACGSSTKPGSNNTPTATTSPPSPATTPAATNPQSGGAGF